jgi:hypothetical protein
MTTVTRNLITPSYSDILRALVAATTPSTPSIGVCACCDEQWAMRSLAPVDTDYTYEKAVRQVSFERDDLVCEDCRADFEHTYGRDADDCFDLYCLGHDSAD